MSAILLPRSQIIWENRLFCLDSPLQISYNCSLHVISKHELNITVIGNTYYNTKFVTSEDIIIGDCHIKKNSDINVCTGSPMKLLIGTKCIVSDKIGAIIPAGKKIFTIYTNRINSIGNFLCRDVSNMCDLRCIELSNKIKVTFCSVVPNLCEFPKEIVQLICSFLEFNKGITYLMQTNKILSQMLIQSREDRFYEYKKLSDKGCLFDYTMAPYVKKIIVHSSIKNYSEIKSKYPHATLYRHRNLIEQVKYFTSTGLTTNSLIKIDDINDTIIRDLDV